jgi:hypothetical protein
MSHRKTDLGIPPLKICQSSARVCTHKSRLFGSGGLMAPRAPRSCHKPEAISHDQKSVGEAHPRGQRRIHLTSETDDTERNEKGPETAPGHKRRPTQRWGKQKLLLAAGEASADQGERNRRSENGNESGYAVQITNDDSSESEPKWIGDSLRPCLQPGRLQSVRAKSCSSFAKNCCHPALAPP